MSDENNENVETVEVEVKSEKKKRTSTKAAVLAVDISSSLEGLPSYEKASFRVYGHKSGVRLALPVTQKIGRAYFYGGDITVDHQAVVSFTAEERKERRLGGVTAEVDFTKGADLAREAIELLAEHVRKYEPVAKPEKKVRVPKVKVEVAVETQAQAE